MRMRHPLTELLMVYIIYAAIKPLTSGLWLRICQVSPATWERPYTRGPTVSGTWDFLSQKEQELLNTKA